MRRLEPARQQYAWGSTSAIPALLGRADDGAPWAEAWYGSHPAGPARVAEGAALSDLIDAEPERLLGEDIIWRFGRRLPFLLKLIAPERPCPSRSTPARRKRPRATPWRKRRASPWTTPLATTRTPITSRRWFWPLTRFQAVARFPGPSPCRRRSSPGLDSILARRIRRTLRLNPTR